MALINVYPSLISRSSSSRKTIGFRLIRLCITVDRLAASTYLLTTPQASYTYFKVTSITDFLN